jgi:hypothetical protein
VDTEEISRWLRYVRERLAEFKYLIASKASDLGLADSAEFQGQSASVAVGGKIG